MLTKTNQMKPLKPNNLGKSYLVEQCRKINISDYLGEARNRLKESMITSQLEVDGLDIGLTISKTNYKGTRFWFKCPVCNKRVGVIYKHPTRAILGCRTCLNLEYRCRKYKGMVENSI